MKPTSRAISKTDLALDRATREQLIAVIQSDANTSVPGIYRASDDALRSAIKTYVRMGRITEQQVLERVLPVELPTDASNQASS